MDLDEPSYPPEGGYCKNGKVRVDLFEIMSTSETENQ